ncbi:MAG: hypothetical protein AAB881_01085 [Patescibacteria group bacterium]|mgnify:CR=1 FL=1
MKQSVGIFIVIVVAILAIGGGLIYYNKSKNSADSNRVADQNGDVKGASDSGESADYKVKLAKFLSQKGMVMYGAYWCVHCKGQKELFGDAFQYVDYVECDAAGENGNPEECKAKGVTGYPTWIYQGKEYEGLLSLSKLAGIVGFSDSGASNADSSTNSTDSTTSTGDNQP